MFVLRMNERQSIAVNLASEGHNLFINGAAGTGKSFVLTEIVRRLGSTRKVYLTSTTGISCMNFPKSAGAMTIHRWAGIEDGRHTTSQLRELMEFSPHFKKAAARIKETDTLIIDEISMLSAKNFDQLEGICRHMNNTKRRFGGIQVIVAGDFLQLPPVPNSLYSDNGEFCFASQLYRESIKHTVTLTEIVRQNDFRFINIIKNISSGHVNEDIINFMKEIERPLKNSDSVKLFANNFLVDNYNRNKVLDINSTLFEYKAKDSGENKYLSKITAQSTLWLKKGVPVILLRNLSQELVNGLKGTVVGFEKDGPVVEFEGGVTTIVKKTLFSGNVNKVRKKAKIRNRYNQAPRLTQDTTWESNKTQ